MGKQPAFKQSNEGKGKRSAPYAKGAKKGGRGPKPTGPSKPTVSVSYEGEAPAATKPVAPKKKPAAKPAPAPKAEKVEKSPKGKGKAVAKVPTPSPEADDTPTFKIIVGTYEKLLYGLEGRYPSGSDVPVLEPIFIFPAHLQCVKAVAASPTGKWLATGSEDEFIKVWDLRRRKEVGSLSQHTGSITSLTFPTPSHLLTTSADATLSLFRTSDWALLKSLKGHSGRVNHVDVHPTGRVALSVGKDQTLKMWDLMRGRGAASLQLGSEAELVKFSPKGTHFAVLYPRKIEIYSLTLKKLHTLETKGRFNHLLFAELPRTAEDMEEEEEAAELLCVGTEKGQVEVYTVEIGDADDDDDEEEGDSDKENAEPSAEVDRIATLVGHTNRIKAVSALPFVSPDGPTVLLTTASSDGLINLYDLGKIPTAETEEQSPIASYDTKGSRLTCVFLADGGAVPKKVKKAAQAQKQGGAGARFAVDDEEEDEDDEDEDEEDEGADMYDVASDDEDDEEGDEDVEFEDEEEEEDEEEDEDEGEYED